MHYNDLAKNKRSDPTGYFLAFVRFSCGRIALAYQEAMHPFLFLGREEKK